MKTAQAYIAFFLLCCLGFTQNTTFNNGGGDFDWSNAANWNNGIPDSLTDAIIGTTTSDTFTVDLTSAANTSGILIGTNITNNVNITIDGAGNPVNITSGSGREIDIRGTNSSLTLNADVLFLGTEGSGLGPRSTNTLTINGNVTNNTTRSLNLRTEGALTINGNINSLTETVRVRDTGTATITGLINTNRLRLDGATLNATNSDAFLNTEEIAVRATSADIIGDLNTNGNIDLRQEGVTGVTLNVDGDFTSPTGSTWLLDASNTASDTVNFTGSVDLSNVTIDLSGHTFDGSGADQTILAAGSITNFASLDATTLFTSLGSLDPSAILITSTSIVLVPEVSTLFPVLALSLPWLFFRRR